MTPSLPALPRSAFQTSPHSPKTTDAPTGRLGAKASKYPIQSPRRQIKVPVMASQSFGQDEKPRFRAERPKAGMLTVRTNRHRARTNGA